MCLTDLNHYKHSKMTIFFEYALTQERIGTVFSGVQPASFSLDHILALESKQNYRGPPKDAKFICFYTRTINITQNV